MPRNAAVAKIHSYLYSHPKKILWQQRQQQENGSTCTGFVSKKFEWKKEKEEKEKDLSYKPTTNAWTKLGSLREGEREREKREEREGNLPLKLEGAPLNNKRILWEYKDL